MQMKITDNDAPLTDGQWRVNGGSAPRKHARLPQADHPAFADVVLVTYKMAYEWLELNRVNREIKRPNVDRFKDLIKRGQFRMTGEPVQFTGFLDDGTAQLYNGQHRLMAIVERGLSQVLVVVQGADVGSQLVMDTGSRRSFNDILSMSRKVANAKTAASITRLGYEVDSSLLSATGGGKAVIANDLLLEWFDAHAAELIDSIRFGRAVADVVGGSITAFSLAKMYYDRIDFDESAAFFEDLTTGANLASGDAMITLRSWLENNSRTRPAPRALLQLAISNKAWNLRRKGVTGRNYLRWTPTGKLREPFPKPI